MDPVSATDTAVQLFPKHSPEELLRAALRASPIDPNAITTALAAVARLRRKDVKPKAMHPIAHALMSVGEEGRAILRREVPEALHEVALQLVDFREKATWGELQWAIHCLKPNSDGMADALITFATIITSYHHGEDLLEEWENIPGWDVQDSEQFCVYLEATFFPTQKKTASN